MSVGLVRVYVGLSLIVSFENLNFLVWRVSFFALKDHQLLTRDISFSTFSSLFLSFSISFFLKVHLFCSSAELWFRFKSRIESFQSSVCLKVVKAWKGLAIGKISDLVSVEMTVKCLVWSSRPLSWGKIKENLLSLTPVLQPSRVITTTDRQADESRVPLLNNNCAYLIKTYPFVLLSWWKINVRTSF